jgi:peptide/nickel transport system substrate-binding protein
MTCNVRFGLKHGRLAVVIGIIIALGVASIAPSCVSNSVAAEGPYRLTVGATQRVDTLNIFAMTLSISYTINFLVYDTLNSVEPNLEPGPQLAHTWETSPNGLVWTFHLVEDAVWHDGQPVTAEDVNFTLRLVMDNKVDAALWIDYLNNVTSVKALDEHTVEITTDVPKATMLTMMVPILPKHLWSHVPVTKIDEVDPWNVTYFPDGPVGSGPLILESYDSTKSEVIMLRNEHYYIDTVKADEVLFKLYGSENVMVSALLSNTIDVAMDVPARLWDSTIAENYLDGQVTSALSFYELGINCATPEWREAFNLASDNLETTNVSVRQAIAMATNKEYMVDSHLKGYAEPGESIIPTATPYWHYTVPPEDVWDYDLDGARALLDAAGYIDNDKDGTRENTTSGVELQFTLYYRKGYVDEANCADTIARSLEQIGIGIELLEVTEGNLYKAWMNCEYDLFIWGWDTDVDPNFMLSTFTEAQYPVDPTDKTKWGDAFWINETYERMYIEQQLAVEKEDRRAIVFNMQKLLYDQCPYVVLYYPMGLHAYDIVDWTNYPNMVDNPGATPGTMWFFFAVTPMDEYVEKYPPENVNAGPDQPCVQGQTLYFYGSATDQDNPLSELTWTWSFAEPDETLNFRYGRNTSYTFENIGSVTVTLTVRDPDLQIASDTLMVTVREVSETDGLIRGVVTDQFSEPVMGANVNVSGEVHITSGEGEYMMYTEEGEYSVLVSRSGYANASGEVTVVAGQTTWANFTLQLTSGTLEGRVYDAETGDPIRAASVAVTYGSVELPSFSTNQTTGFYQFEEVSVGEVTVTVTKNGYEKNTTIAIVVAGETTVHDVYLTPVAEEGGKLDTLTIAALAAIAIIAIAAVAFYMMRKKGKAEEPPPPPAQ